MTTTRETASEPVGASSAAGLTGTPRAPRPGRAWWVIAAVVAVSAVPLMVTLGVLHQPHYYPLLDLAQTEMRIRDVASMHPPLLGLPGRIGSYPIQGSHPGPISFYALFPFYELWGASAWAMQAASASLHLLALVVALWIAKRRGGIPLVLGVGAAFALLYASYGGAILTEAWNPYLPVSWWVVFLLAVWSVACGDLPMLPVAVFAGSFCMQTELPYVGLGGAIVLLLFAYVGITTYRARADRAAVRDALRWCAIAVGVAVVLWLPSLVEQFTHSPGNLTLIERDLRHPQDPTAGVHKGLNLWLVHLNPVAVITNRGLVPAVRATTGTTLPGAIFLVVWAAAAIVAWRRRDRSLVRLHAVIAVALVLGLFSMVKISGTLWYYLTLWAWGTTTLMLVAIVATAVSLVAPHLHGSARSRAAQLGIGALVATIVASTIFFADEAAYTQVPNPPVTNSVGAVVGPTVAALQARDRAAGRHERYLVTWDDAMTVGARGYALLNELERRGFRVGADAVNRVGVRSHRVLSPHDADAEVHLVSGGEIAPWARRPGEQRIAFFDPRTAAQRTEFEQLRGQVEGELRAAGLDADAASIANDNLLAVLYDPKLPASAARPLERMLTLGLPVAVFVGPAHS